MARYGKNHKGGPKLKLDNANRRSKLLRALRESGNRAHAARAAGVSHQTVITYCESHPEFAQEMEDAKDESMQTLEVVAYKKAKRGDGPMLRFLLATQLPEKYSLRQRLEHSGRIDGNVRIQVVEDEDWYGNGITGNRAASLVAESDAAPNGSALESGAIQGSGVRPTMGQNGHRSNGHH